MSEEGEAMLAEVQTWRAEAQAGFDTLRKRFDTVEKRLQELYQLFHDHLYPRGET